MSNPGRSARVSQRLGSSRIDGWLYRVNRRPTVFIGAMYRIIGRGCPGWTFGNVSLVIPKRLYEDMMAIPDYKVQL